MNATHNNNSYINNLDTHTQGAACFLSHLGTHTHRENSTLYTKCPERSERTRATDVAKHVRTERTVEYFRLLVEMVKLILLCDHGTVSRQTSFTLCVVGVVRANTGLHFMWERRIRRSLNDSITTVLYWQALNLLLTFAVCTQESRCSPRFKSTLCLRRYLTETNES